MTATPAVHPLDHASPAPRPLPRAWPAVAIVAVFWVFHFVSTQVEFQMFYRFLAQMAVLGVVLISFLIWWLTRRSVSRRERWLAFGAMAVAAVLTVLLSHKSMGPMPIFGGVPWLLTGWAAWIWLTRSLNTGARHPGLREAGMIVIPFLAFGTFLLLRMEGLRGDGNPQFHWRWSPTPEDQFLAGGRQSSGPTVATSSPTTSPTTRSAALVPQPGDWPAFRGPNRDANVHGVRIATDWDAHPPKKLWSQHVGPAWSSITVVAGRAFTQEQRGDTELVVCRDAETGVTLWTHDDASRFEESLSGVGPRATPTFDNGLLYTLGARGTLNCLDAADGRRVWSHDIAADAQAKVPDWGFCSSPLVTGGKVIVYAGGKSKKSLLAYDAATGNLAWSAPAGEWSYSSPHLATINGAEQVLFLSDHGVTAVDPSTGAVQWEHAMPGTAPRSVQPLPVGSNQVIANLGLDSPTTLIEVPAPAGASPKPTEHWTSRNLKPSFNDFVVHNGYAYGFDGTMFSCVDLKDGSRKWKKGRYGAGQVLLLPDQPVLLVITEQGEAVLVAADPTQHKELGRFQAVTGKTWNHPAIAQGRLYVRSADELACYELQPAP